MKSTSFLSYGRKVPLLVLTAVLGMLTSMPAVGQQQKLAPGLPYPRLLIVSPCGGKASSTVEVVATGQDLDDAREILFSHPGIKAEAITSGPSRESRSKDKSNRSDTTSYTTSVKFQAIIGPDVPPGIHDLRIVNRWGVSNPRAFVVGDANEVQEKESNNDINEAQRIDLDSTVNGVISSSTDVDYFVFKGKKDQRVVVSCLSSSIDSKFPASVQLFDGDRHLLASNRNYSGNDALADCTLLADGDYHVRVFSFTYAQGSPEHFYRLSVSTSPWIDAVFPSVVEPGKEAALTLFGRNLPNGKLDPGAVVDGRVLEKATVSVTAPKEPADLQRLVSRGFLPLRATVLDGFEYRLRNETGVSNSVLLTLAQAPVVVENDAGNDEAESAQEVSLPCEIVGRIEKRRDRDWYAFNARKGDVFSIDAYGDRLGSSIDLYFTMRGPDGKSLGEFDDNTEVLKSSQFFARTEDPSRQRFTVPSDGKYQMQISSREADVQAGPRDQYRVRITPEQPDFRFVIMPALATGPDACTVRAGGRQYFTAFFWRLDGFNGDIALSAEGLPPGVVCPGQSIGPGMRQCALVFAADEDAKPWTGEIRVKGTAMIAGRTIVREARPASITWPGQQNVPAIARLDRNLVLAVREKAAFALQSDIEKVATLPGEKVVIPLKVKRLSPDARAAIQVTALNLPSNVASAASSNNNNPLVTIAADKDDAEVVLDIKSTVAPGVYSIVLLGQAQLPYARDALGKDKATTTVVQPSAPIVLTVFPKQVAEIVVTSAGSKAKLGEPAELTVKVNRLSGYTGEFTLRLVLPNGVKGIRADEVTIPAGKDEAKLVLQVASDAPTGKLSGANVQATAKINDKITSTQDGKIALTLEK